MPRSTSRRDNPIIWIPPSGIPAYRVEVIRSDGTIDNITNLLDYLMIEEEVTDGIGNFEFRIPNFNNFYSSVWNGMETLKFYSGYDVNNLTLRFIGRLEKPTKADNFLVGKGRNEALFVMDEMVTLARNDVDAGLILKTLFQNYGGNRFNVDSINTSTGVLLTVDWSEKNFWECVSELCASSGYDCYVDANLIVKFFIQNSINNDDDVILHSYNLLETGDFAPDFSQVRNKVRVYGATVDGVQIIYTSDDFDSQQKYGVKRELINDESIITNEQAKSIADSKLEELKEAPITGEVKSTFIPTIQPGQMLRISDPQNDLTPKYYRIFKYKHEIGTEDYTTTVTINKEPLKLHLILKDRLKVENKTSNTSSNPGDFNFSYIDYFNSDSGSHSNTSITGGYLVATAASGTWTSGLIPTNGGNDVKSLTIIVDGSTISANTYQFTVDGTNYETFTPGVTKIPGFTGNQLKVKITLNNANAQLNSYSILYNTQ